MPHVTRVLRVSHSLNPDLGCLADDCQASTVEGAPAPLCQRHLELAFAFVAGQRRERPGRQTRPFRETPGWVYFFRVGKLIKIGWTKRDPDIRFRELAADEVLHVEPGTMNDEHRCHAAFAHLRNYLEYFNEAPDLLAFIADLKAKDAA
jgi:hypothetical protein